MKTLTQILDEKAKEVFFRDFNHLLEAYSNWNESVHSIDLNKIISFAALEYAEQDAIAFKDFCDENEREMRLENYHAKEAYTTKSLYHSEEFKKFKEGK
jgi:hypothetical protein